LLTKPIEEEGRNFKISLKDYNHKEPAFELPYVNEDLDAYRKRVENFFKFSFMTDLRSVEITPEIYGDTIIALWKIIDERYKEGNIIIHDIFLWSSTARDPKNLDFKLPEGDETGYFVPLHDTILSGGLGNALLYGWQGDSLLGDPENFLITNRRKGVLEAFMHPMTKI
jgi:hypothetical protein